MKPTSIFVLKQSESGRRPALSLQEAVRCKRNRVRRLFACADIYEQRALNVLYL